MIEYGINVSKLLTTSADNQIMWGFFLLLLFFFKTRFNIFSFVFFFKSRINIPTISKPLKL